MSVNVPLHGSDPSPVKTGSDQSRLYYQVQVVTTLLTKLEPPSGRVFSHVLWERMVSHTDREPMLLALILWLPLSRLASSQTPTDPMASLLSQCHPTTPPHHQPNPYTYSYTKPATAIHWHPVDLPSRMAVTLPVRLSTYCCT